MMFLAWCHFLFLSVVVNPETEKINKIPFCCKKKIGESGGKFWVIQIFIFISPSPSPSLACLPVTSELIAKNFSSTPSLLANSPLSLKVRKNEFLSLPATPPVRSSRWRIRSVLAIISGVFSWHSSWYFPSPWALSVSISTEVRLFIHCACQFAHFLSASFSQTRTKYFSIIPLKYISVQEFSTLFFGFLKYFLPRFHALHKL